MKGHVNEKTTDKKHGNVSIGNKETMNTFAFDRYSMENHNNENKSHDTYLNAR